MTYRLSVNSLTNAASHLCKYGDTDVFPRLVELLFLSEQKSAVIDELKELDLDQYSPGNAFEALAPKSRFGFRIAHQLPFVDTILLLAAVIEIGNLMRPTGPLLGVLKPSLIVFKQTSMEEYSATTTRLRIGLLRSIIFWTPMIRLQRLSAPIFPIFTQGSISTDLTICLMR